MATDVINPKYTVFDLGYEKYLAKSDSFYDDQGANADKVTQSLPSILIGGGGLIGNITMVDGFLQSSNYVAGLTGWKLTEDTAYFPNIILSGYLLATGGAYKTAATGSRVEIFPDANTGIIAYDDAGNTVFTVLVGGTNQGDVVIGDFANSKGVMWDKSAGTFIVKGSIVTEAGSEISGEYIDALNVGKLTSGEIVSKLITLSFTEGVGDCAISCGKTDFGQYNTRGFILGIDDSDSNKPKFEITGGEIFGSLVNLFFGNGEDGSRTLDGINDCPGTTRDGNTYTMDRDLYLANLTINSGITLITNGYALMCVGTLTNNGTIHNNGSDGVAGELGARADESLPGISNGGAGGAGGGAILSTFGRATSGADGGDSQISTSWPESETAETDGGAGIAQNPSLGVSGTNGGNGAGSYYSTDDYFGNFRGVGGAGGVATAETLQFLPKSTEYTGSNTFTLDTAVLFGPSGKISKSALSHSAGAGGGGAGQCARGEISSGHYTYINGGGGGGGGGAGGIVYIAAKNIVNNGTINSLGGAGGNGGNASSYPGIVASGRGGGGGGGAGGVIILVYANGSPGSFSSGNVAGGAGGPDGTGGSGGGPSFPSTDGQSGGKGKYYLFHLTT